MCSKHARTICAISGISVKIAFPGVRWDVFVGDAAEGVIKRFLGFLRASFQLYRRELLMTIGLLGLGHLMNIPLKRFCGIPIFCCSFRE